VAKPSRELRKQLIIAGATAARQGRLSDAGLEICNAFYSNDHNPPSGDYSIFNEYWNLMVCVLADRCARAEHIAEIERARRFGGGEVDDREPVTEDWLKLEYKSEQTEFGWCIEHDSFPVFLMRSWKHPDVWVARIDDDPFPIDIHARIQVRSLVRLCQEL